ncbi:MAG: uracil-DNA glycosylase [Phycisphaerales bacterium]|nr:uracil-DNA glycosylase [Phycisphaerales bacterium]
MENDARHLIAQHAETARLLGVNFLPLGTPPSSLVENTAQSVETRPAVQEAAAPSTERLSKPAPPPAVSIAEIRASYEGKESSGDRLEALRAKYEFDAPHKHFAQGFTNIVFGEGDPDAELMFIGEAPGQQEDETGRPFVGRAGQLLEKMIVAMGLSRQRVYICNVLKARPPNNATPSVEESQACAPYLYEQIRIIKPKVIVTLGLPATHTVLQTQGTMRSLRGRWHEFAPELGEQIGVGGIAIMPTYHPAYLLRSYTEENRRKVWADLQMVQGRLSPG